MPDASVAGTAAAALAVAMVFLWLLSLQRKDSSIVDIFWGLGFVLVAWIGVARGHGPLPRKLLVAALVTVWGARLAGYLAWRNLGHGEDPRYQAMRRRHGARWPLRSLVIVFGLQGALIWIISLPLLVALSLPSPAAIGPIEVVGAAVTLVGVAFESIGDIQLAAWKRDPAHKGRVMDRGLWRYTRHPNYFGDFLVWWGLYGIAAATGIGAWTIVSPALMSFLLLRVSGVTLLEAALKKRPGYDDYVRRTSAFFPLPPR